MGLSADRASGAFFLLFGLAAYFLVIPAYVEQAEGGNIAPDMLPNAIAIVIAACGFLLMVKPTPQQLPGVRYFALTGAYVFVLAAAIYAMSWFGFIYVAPFLALAIMLMIGERRPLWLAFGALGMPATIWVFVIIILDRALP
ncbi:tripartite tricarboxylate transporter TctB family protein [Hoeflea sp.]|uniref:tripartite tricarboxylate transporter TctB family protein n=1 Tax=Hoeflea sp. TaxID=1940281 RepID=UPI003B022052